MPRSKDGKPVKAVKKKSHRKDPPTATGTEWWKKPPRWVGGILLVALGAALNDPLVFVFGRLIENFIPKIGDPISAVVTLEPALYDVVLTRPGALSKQDLDSLAGLGLLGQMSRLEEKGGIPLGTRTLKVEFKSNRPYPVRVTGMNPVSDCKEPVRGTLVKTSLLPKGTTRSSTVMVLNADDPRKGAEVQDPGSNGEPFFPGGPLPLRLPSGTTWCWSYGPAKQNSATFMSRSRSSTATRKFANASLQETKVFHCCRSKRPMNARHSTRPCTWQEASATGRS
jgi:hypothetical protein